MKKLFAGLMAIVMTLSLTACSSDSPNSSAAADFGAVLAESRGAHSDMDFPVISSAEDESAPMIFDALGFTAEDCEQFAMSVSMMNVHAYGIVIVKPTPEKAADVSAALDNFIALQQRNFEMYLPDQYEIAMAAVKKELPDGTLIMVISEKSAEIAADIESALTGK